jgi:CheY-like chemotaxis protein
MAKIILVLEDNADRREAMRKWLEERLSMYRLVLTDDPDQFVTLLQIHGPDVLVASLDHDLFDRADGSTELTGMQVVDHLVHLPATFPLLLHTSNRRDGETMRERLADAGWSVNWVHPFDGTSWISTDWYHALKRAIRTTAVREKTVPADDYD